MTNDNIKKGLKKYHEDRISRKDFEIQDSLAIVDSFCEDHLDKYIFRDLDVLFIQHCFLAPFIGRINAMIDYGKLDPDKVWLVDIPYSSNNEVRTELNKIISKDKISPKYDNPLLKYKDTQQTRVVNAIRDIAQESKNKLLCVDDGAYFIRNLIELENTDSKLVENLCNRPISVVEQTTRGHRYFTDKETKKEYTQFLERNNISVVSIARTKTKKEVITRIFQMVQNLKIMSPHKKHCIKLKKHRTK